jgi:hypothetical protein
MGGLSARAEVSRGGRGLAGGRFTVSLAPLVYLDRAKPFEECMRIPAWRGGAGDSSCTTAGAVWHAGRDGIGVRRGWHIRWDTGTRPGWFAAAESLHARRTEKGDDDQST